MQKFLVVVLVIFLQTAHMAQARSKENHGIHNLRHTISPMIDVGLPSFLPPVRATSLTSSGDFARTLFPGAKCE